MNLNLKLLLLILIIFCGFLILPHYRNKIKTFQFLALIEHQNIIQTNKEINLEYENINFAVIKRTSCTTCGLFSNYIVYLGCLRKCLIDGFVPILEFESYKNIMNGFIVDPLKGNPWEYFFNQPFGFKYSNIKIKAKNIKYIECEPNVRPNEDIFLNKNLMNYWHILANQYIPIKNEIINLMKL